MADEDKLKKIDDVYFEYSKEKVKLRDRTRPCHVTPISDKFYTIDPRFYDQSNLAHLFYRIVLYLCFFGKADVVQVIGCFEDIEEYHTLFDKEMNYHHTEREMQGCSTPLREMLIDR